MGRWRFEEAALDALRVELIERARVMTVRESRQGAAQK